MFVNIVLIIFVFIVVIRKLNIFLVDIPIKSKLYIVFFTIEHFLITLIFAFFLDHFTSINDPQRFYKIAIESDSWLSLFGFGNAFMPFLVYPFAKIGVDLKVLFLLCSLLGWMGFLSLFEALEYRNQKNISIFYLLFLVPSIHLWTSSLSKEPLLLFFISVIIYQVKINNIKEYKTLISFVLILLIRPHVFFPMCGVLLIIFMLKEKKMTIKKKLSVFLVSLITIFIGLYFSIIYFLKVKDFNVDYLKYRLQLFVEVHSNSGNSGISLLDTNIFERILCLLYMPLPLIYSSENFFQLYISIENLIYVLFSLYILYLFLFKKKKPISWHNDIIFTLSVSIILIFLFGSYLYNFGLGNRMRIMFYPTLFYVLIKIDEQRVFTKQKDKSNSVLL